MSSNDFENVNITSNLAVAGSSTFEGSVTNNGTTRLNSTALAFGMFYCAGPSNQFTGGATFGDGSDTTFNGKAVIGSLGLTVEGPFVHAGPAVATYNGVLYANVGMIVTGDASFNGDINVLSGDISLNVHLSV